MRTAGIIVLCVVVASLIGVGCSMANLACRYANDAKEAAFNETKASELLRKYSWFKDAAAACDQKLATLKIYETRIINLTKQYEGAKRREWARDDREQYSIWQSEMAGMAASYNGVAAEYNSQMSKINWAFCNQGTLPKGAETPLPREFKPYLTEF